MSLQEKDTGRWSASGGPEQTTKIASNATANYELSDHTFAHNQANLSHKVIEDILKSFNVEDP